MHRKRRRDCAAIRTHALTSGAIWPRWKRTVFSLTWISAARARAFHALGDAFGVLDGDRVEREDGGVLRGRRRDQVRRGGQGHGATRCRATDVLYIT